MFPGPRFHKLKSTNWLKYTNSLKVKSTNWLKYTNSLKVKSTIFNQFHKQTQTQ